MRPRIYTLYEIQRHGKKQVQKHIGEAIPFSQSYGFTLFIEGGIKLIMHPAPDYSRRKRKFDVLAAGDDGKDRLRLHLGQGWKSDYGNVYNLTLYDSDGSVLMKVKMLPKLNYQSRSRQSPVTSE